MNGISCGATALVGLALSLGVSACASDGTAKPVLPATTTETSDPPYSSTAKGPESVPEPSGTGAVDAFSKYAVGGPPDVPWASGVVYSIEGVRVAQFGDDVADLRATWEGCPRETVTYEGRDCPVSPLRTIAYLVREGGWVVYQKEPPSTVGCNRYHRALTEAGTTIWIRPDEESRDCFSDFAVAVSLDRSGRIVSVDLALSGP